MQKELLMSTEKRITEALEGALRLPLTPQSRYILMSDCHRGTGNANDNFLKNEYLYLAALQYYFAGNFTYIELGDGDELWENTDMVGGGSESSGRELQENTGEDRPECRYDCCGKSRCVRTWSSGDGTDAGKSRVQVFCYCISSGGR